MCLLIYVCLCIFCVMTLLTIMHIYIYVYKTMFCLYKMRSLLAKAGWQTCLAVSSQAFHGSLCSCSCAIACRMSSSQGRVGWTACSFRAM